LLENYLKSMFNCVIYIIVIINQLCSAYTINLRMRVYVQTQKRYKDDIVK